MIQPIHLLSAGQTRERSPNLLLDFKTKYIKTIIFRFNVHGTAVLIYVYINKSDNHHIVFTPASISHSRCVKVGKIFLFSLRLLTNAYNRIFQTNFYIAKDNTRNTKFIHMLTSNKLGHVT